MIIMKKKQPQTPEEKAISQWLTEGFKDKKKVKSHLADICGVSRQSVGDWVKTGQVDKKHFTNISTYLEKPIPEVVLGATSPTFRKYHNDVYQTVDPEHREVVDNIANKLLLMTREEAENLEKAMELLRGRVTK